MWAEIIRPVIFPRLWFPTPPPHSPTQTPTRPFQLRSSGREKKKCKYFAFIVTFTLTRILPGCLTGWDDFQICIVGSNKFAGFPRAAGRGRDPSDKVAASVINHAVGWRMAFGPSFVARADARLIICTVISWENVRKCQLWVEKEGMLGSGKWHGVEEGGSRRRRKGGREAWTVTEVSLMPANKMRISWRGLRASYSVIMAKRETESGNSRANVMGVLLASCNISPQCPRPLSL